MLHAKNGQNTLGYREIVRLMLGRARAGVQTTNGKVKTHVGLNWPDTAENTCTVGLREAAAPAV